MPLYIVLNEHFIFHPKLLLFCLQAVNLTAHWEKVSEDIKQVIPDAGFTGLGVIDWEAWRPMWERNWDAKKVYQDLSLARVRTEHPDWGQKHVERAAKKQFENAAR